MSTDRDEGSRGRARSRAHLENASPSLAPHGPESGGLERRGLPRARPQLQAIGFYSALNEQSQACETAAARFSGDCRLPPELRPSCCEGGRLSAVAARTDRARRDATRRAPSLGGRLLTLTSRGRCVRACEGLFGDPTSEACAASLGYLNCLYGAQPRLAG